MNELRYLSVKNISIMEKTNKQTKSKKKIFLSAPNGGPTYDPPITSSDVLLLKYRRLLGAKSLNLFNMTILFWSK